MRLLRLNVFWAMLALAGGVWVSFARASGPDAAPIQSLLLPQVGQADPSFGASSSGRVLARDSGIAYSYHDGWAAGDRAGVRLQAADGEYPLTIRSVSAYMGCLPADAYPGASRSVSLRAHIYALSGDLPGALLGSAPDVLVDLSSPECQGWVSLDLASSQITLAQPQPFLAVVEYIGGLAGQTPSLLSDVSSDIPVGQCFYFRQGSWREHYAFWQVGRDTGYSMIRATADVAGGPYGWGTTLSLAAADTFLVSAYPQINQGTQPHLLVGNHGAWGLVRPMLRFALPQAPAPGAQVVAANVRVLNYHAVSESLPVTLTLYRVTAPWEEASATWATHATAYGEAYGSASIMAREAAETYRLRLLEFEVTALVSAWSSGATPNHGVMLRGGEETASSNKWLYARESVVIAHQPQLVAQWRWPLVTPSPSPPATPTPDPTLRRAALLPLIVRR